MFNVREFRFLSDDERLEKIENLLNDEKHADILFKKILDKGHGLKLHSEQTSEEMVRRTMVEMHSTSSFISAEDALALIDLSIYLERKKICDWLAGKDRKPSILCSVCVGEIAGTGIDINLKEKNTDMVTFKLERDTDYSNDLGFCVVTAYPDITHENSQFTEKIYQKEAADQINNLPSDMCRGYWGLKLAGAHPRTNLKDCERVVYANFTKNNNEYSIKFSDYSTPRLFIKGNDSWVHIDLKNVSKEIQDSFNKYIKIYDTAVKNKNIEFNNYEEKDKFKSRIVSERY